MLNLVATSWMVNYAGIIAAVKVDNPRQKG
jgi:hypothetical protein